MDRALDEIVAERHNDSRSKVRRGGRRPERNYYPRDGIRKVWLYFLSEHLQNRLMESQFQSIRDGSRNIDSEWVHDKFDDHTGRQPGRINRRFSPVPDHEPPSAKLRVDNLHYDLTEDDLDDLFNRIGPVLSLSLVYDRAGRSEGIAYVTYESSYHAKKAIREFDGANAKGQPIHLISIPSGPSGGRRNTAAPPSRSLFDRVTLPAERSRSVSRHRHSNLSSSTHNNVDRYVPHRDRRSRSPRPVRRDGRRPGIRKERGDRNVGGVGGERQVRYGRPKKTQEELDAEMEDYWIGKNTNTTENSAPAPAAIPMDDKMVE